LLAVLGAALVQVHGLALAHDLGVQAALAGGAQAARAAQDPVSTTVEIDRRRRGHGPEYTGSPGREIWIILARR
jgi:hypothetical protein